MTDHLPHHDLLKRLRDAEALLESYRAASQLHSMRADAHSEEVARVRHLLWGWNRSGFSRMGRLAREVWLIRKGEFHGRSTRVLLEQVKTVFGREGVAGVARHVKRRVGVYFRIPKKARSGNVPAVSPAPEPEKPVSPYRQPVGRARDRGLTPRIVIIAELSIPQCAKYRVWQKKEELEVLGWDVEVVNWHNPEAALTAMQTAWEVIFYRVPAESFIKTLLEEAKRLGLAPWWEVDDLIFDLDLYGKNSNLLSLSEAEQKNLLHGAKMYRECLQLCGRGIASTPVLADVMTQAGVKDVCVIENALDGETLRIADRILASATSRVTADDEILIVYGSGTRTHDKDFVECAQGLLEAMTQEPRLRLRIVGELTLPEEFERFEDRVEHLKGRDYAGYMALLAEADIAIAPLEPSIFNDAKSNIKFLEAAILRIPSVCSPSDTFSTIVENGRNGFLASDPAGWREALLRLARDPALRAETGAVAREDVLVRYRPEAIARSQVAAGFPFPTVEADDRLRVLAVNIFFTPRSFGGATFVAEEMVRHLPVTTTNVSVFTSCEFVPHLAKSLLRYEAEGKTIVASPLPLHMDPVAGLDQPRCAAQFTAWVKAFRPDVVHFHSIQGLGIGLLQVCIELGIPYVVTLHDAWWLCERQFMVRPDGRYCFQKRIDLKTCESCVPAALHLGLRQEMMLSVLGQAALLLSPSESHRQLYLANGFAPEQVKVNRNGFSWPKKPRPPRSAGLPLRFGFVGGAEAVKGFPLIRETFEALRLSNWELVLIDNTLNLGFASLDVSGWKVTGKITILPAYNDETRDDFFNGIDVLLFPSQWMESYGLTVREALSRDVWVISTAPGGQSEDIVDGVNGTLIPLDGQPEHLMRAVQELFDRKELFGAYRNPLKDGLPTFETQAVELRMFLQSVTS